MKKFLSFCLAFVLIVPAMALLSACDDKKQDVPEQKVYEGFVFEDNKMVGYYGYSTEIVVPSSYSIYDTNSNVYTMDYKISDILNYDDESLSYYDIWATDISNYDRLVLAGGMYNVSINNGEKEFVRVGDVVDFFTQVKKDYTDLNTTISIELTDYTLTPEDGIEEYNISCITRPLMQMFTGRLKSFSVTCNDTTLNITKENFLQNMDTFEEILAGGALTDDVTYKMGHYIEFVEGDDIQVDTITALEPSYIMGGGLFDVPELTKVTIPASIKTIDANAFDNVTTLTNVVIESPEIYNALTDISACGNLILNATQISVLKQIVDSTENANEFLNVNGGYTKTEDGNYYVFSKEI